MENLCLCLQNLTFCSWELLRDFVLNRTLQTRPLQPFWKLLRVWCCYLLRSHMINWSCQFAVLTEKKKKKAKQTKKHQQTSRPKAPDSSAKQELGKYHREPTEMFPVVHVGSCILKMKRKKVSQPRVTCSTAINSYLFFMQTLPFKTMHLENFTCLTWGPGRTWPYQVLPLCILPSNTAPG